MRKLKIALYPSGMKFNERCKQGTTRKKKNSQNQGHS